MKTGGLLINRRKEERAFPQTNALAGSVPGKERHHIGAATDEAIQSDYSYQMSRNRISVKTLDLNRDFSEISAQLNAIVADHFD